LASEDSPARLTWTALTLVARNPFRLAYGVELTRQVFWIRLEEDLGWGEAAIPPYYGVEQSAMIACWQQAARQTRPWPEQPEEVAGWVSSGCARGPAPARCALELALYDRIARQRGVPLYALLGLPRPPARPTAYTIAINTPQEMARLAREAHDFPVIKVKLGGTEDEECLAAIREARPDAHLRVDCNAGWTLDEAQRRIPRLEQYGLEMIEQPLPRQEIAGLGVLQKQTSTPIVADESLQSFEDLEQIAAAGVQGINLKLMKIGGITPALRVLQRAKQLGLRVMLGCMLETSLGTTAMAHLSGLADWLDLDAPMLITNDPFDGLQYDAYAAVLIPDRPGIGVRLK